VNLCRPSQLCSVELFNNFWSREDLWLWRTRSRFSLAYVHVLDHIRGVYII
jgi:hypothetical protein